MKPQQNGVQITWAITCPLSFSLFFLLPHPISPPHSPSPLTAAAATPPASAQIGKSHPIPSLGCATTETCAQHRPSAPLPEVARRRLKPKPEVAFFFSFLKADGDFTLMSKKHVKREEIEDKVIWITGASRGIDNEILYPTINTYDVIFFGESIYTVVTCDPSVVTHWISRIESINKQRNLIVGLDIEWHPSYHRNVNNLANLPVPPLLPSSIPDKLFEFLENPNYKFVGLG
ncbi:hypothetical protein ACS0TY_021356 [Phlomoides rotata]